MQRCEFEVLYGIPETVAVTVTTPDGSLTIVPDRAEHQKSVKDFAERWARASTPSEYLGYLDEFSALAGTAWRQAIGREPPSATRYRFTVTPIVERAPRKKTGFSMKKNDERLFYRQKPAIDYVK